MSKIQTKQVINPFKIVTRTITRFYLILYLIIIVSLLIVAVFIFTDILTKPQTVTMSDITIDQPTSENQDEKLILNQINKYETSSSNNYFQNVNPGIRSNPFSE